MTSARWIPVVLVGFLVGAIAISAVGAGKPKSEVTSKIQWQTDLKAAHKISVESNRPMLVVFDAKWCTYCRKMDGTTFADPKLASYVNDAFVPVHLDLTKSEAIAEILEVKRIPCTVALSPRADLLGRLEGYVNTDQYHSTLVRIKGLQTKVDRQLARIAKE